MPATEEQKAILSVLHLLLKSGEQWMRFDRPDASTEAANAATGNFVALRENELDESLALCGKGRSF